MKAARAKSTAAKRLRRRNRAIALERSYQRLKTAIYQASLFSSGAVAVVMALELFGIAAPGATASGPFQYADVRHYTFVIAVIASSYFGSVFSFGRRAASTIPAKALLLLGAAFGLVARLSFASAVELAGIAGGMLWILLLALAISFAGTLRVTRREASRTRR